MDVTLAEGREAIEKKGLFMKTISLCFVLFEFVVCIVRFYQSRTSALIYCRFDCCVFRLHSLSMSSWCCGVYLMSFT